MVMVIGSSHSTLKDTLPTVRKIEKSQNLNIFQLRYALLLEQPFQMPIFLRLKISFEQINYVISH